MSSLTQANQISTISSKQKQNIIQDINEVDEGQDVVEKVLSILNSGTLGNININITNVEADSINSSNLQVSNDLIIG